MKNPNTDIYEMLAPLSLPVAAQRFMELFKSPELCNYSTCSSFVRFWNHNTQKRSTIDSKQI